MTVFDWKVRVQFYTEQWTVVYNSREHLGIVVYIPFVYRSPDRVDELDIDTEIVRHEQRIRELQRRLEVASRRHNEGAGREEVEEEEPKRTFKMPNVQEIL